MSMLEHHLTVYQNLVLMGYSDHTWELEYNGCTIKKFRSYGQASDAAYKLKRTLIDIEKEDSPIEGAT